MTFTSSTRVIETGQVLTNLKPIQGQNSITLKKKTKKNKCPFDSLYKGPRSLKPKKLQSNTKPQPNQIQTCALSLNTLQWAANLWKCLLNRHNPGINGVIQLCKKLFLSNPLRMCNQASSWNCLRSIFKAHPPWLSVMKELKRSSGVTDMCGIYRLIQYKNSHIKEKTSVLVFKMAFLY